jgi:tRNA(Met) cytidine acetyltransferase
MLAVMDELRHLTAQMAREGIRRLLVLSGDDAWTCAGAAAA